MDQREHQLQYLNICIRLFDFLKSLSSQALKTLTLDPPPLMNHGFSHQMAAASPGGAALSGAKIELDPHGRELQPVQDNDSQMEEEETLASAAPQPKAPKKTVSFHDVVEEINIKANQNKRMNKTTKKSTSLEHKEDPKPLRSILKVGPKLNENSDSFRET